MVARLHFSSPQFEADFSAFLRQRDAGAEDVSGVVKAILDDVRQQGDAALLAYTAKFDGFTPDATTVRFSKEAIAAATGQCDANVVASLRLAAQRIRAYHQTQMPQDYKDIDAGGTLLGWRWNAVDAVGLYVPGGLASYPSSVLMNAIPAKVAGVARLVMVVPTPRGEVNPAILAAAHIAGVDEIYRVGGAQAVAALAYGTESIAQVDKIVGPGNAYVAEAKRQVFGTVGIDMIAGPSEILVVSDNQTHPDWVAADLLSQSEHDASAQSILVTDDPVYAELVAVSVEETLRRLPREPIARKAWENHGAIIVVPSLAEAPGIVNRLAPEHLELCVTDPLALMKDIRHAGAIFVGRHTPEAIGDYIAGPSHVLPTSRTARFSSGLGVFDFLKRSSIIHCSEGSFAALGAAAATLADCEGLGAHALSVRVRQGEQG